MRGWRDSTQDLPPSDVYSSPYDEWLDGYGQSRERPSLLVRLVGAVVAFVIRKADLE
jgi:hypothetical protein